MPRLADMKIWIRLTAAIWLILAIIWTGMIFWTTNANRDTAVRQATDFAQSIHEMTMAGLTGMMITGTVGQREVFLDQIKQLAIIKDLHVARSEAVVKLYGPDTKSTRQLDAQEQQVMSSGKPYISNETVDPVPSSALSTRPSLRKTIWAKIAYFAIRFPKEQCLASSA
jgi:methyl-accepting chemotaxis protein